MVRQHQAMPWSTSIPPFYGPVSNHGMAGQVPVLRALDEACRVSYPDHRFIFGLDANTQAR